MNRLALFGWFEMIRFHAGIVIVLTRDLNNEISLLGMRAVDGDGDLPIASPDAAIHRSGLIRTLGQLLDHPEEMPISSAMRWKIETFKKRVENDDDPLTVTQAEALLKDMHNDLIREISSPYCLLIPSERRSLYEQKRPLFGDQAAAQFPDAARDIEAAGRCIALDEWTAAVFHLMRVLEKGLHSLATELQIPMAANVELENWKNIIDQIEKKIRDLEQLPKSPIKSETLKVYAQMASNFWYFKEAWRNHVSHSRATYDERAALNVFSHTRIFMDELATAMAS